MLELTFAIFQGLESLPINWFEQMALGKIIKNTK